jgi:hypothetical protein
LRLNVSTVAKVLARYEAPRLSWTDPAPGCRLRAKPKAFRYEHTAPGDLVHVDIKKLGRIPDGGGHRFLGRAAGVRVKKGAKPGTAYIHHAMDDHSRLVYSEILADERKETASAFWTRANNYFNGCGITVLRVLTDNGSPYRSKLFAQTLGAITHKRTRPYRPQTKPQVAYCTPSGRFVGMLCSFRSPAGASVSLVEGRRVGLGRVVEQFVLIVIALPTDKTGVVPGFDGRGGHAEQYGHLAEGDQAGATQPLLAAA